MNHDFKLPSHALFGSGPVLDAFAAHVRGGGVFAYPTSTVYGFGTIVDGEAIDELANLKRRPEGKRFLVVSGQRASFETLEWPVGALRLAQRYWPGPLTLILRDPQDSFPKNLRGISGGVAVRHSRHPIVRMIESVAGSPLTSTSANPPGVPPTRDAFAAQGALVSLGAERPWVVDGGRLRPSPSSTIVDCTVEPHRVLREGTLSLQEIESGLEEEPAQRTMGAHPPFHILFVCTGNTCRSPLAEAIARQRLSELGWAATAASAGVFAAHGAPASHDSVAVAAAHGLDINNHRARQLDAELIAGADLILTMSPAHVDAATEIGGAGKVTLLGAFAAGSEERDGGVAVMDPIGMGREVYEATYAQLTQLINGALERLRPLLAATP